MFSPVIVLRAVVILLSLGYLATTAPAQSGFSIDNIDKSVDPCTDFYQFACGNWMKKTEIPQDRPSVNSFVEVDERNLVTLREILEKASSGGSARNPIDQKIGDYYGACMDEQAVNRQGLAPLSAELERIDRAKDKSALIDAIARVHLIGPNPLFNFYASPDLHNADMVIAYIDQGGLSLPDRNYYLKDDPKMVEARKSLSDYIIALSTLSHASASEAQASAEMVLRIETALARASMDLTLRRDPKNLDHKMSRQAAIRLAPSLSLAVYFSDLSTPDFSDLNVANPDFFKQLNAVLESESLEALKTYVKWHLLNDAAPWLANPYVEANFKFRQALNGQAEIQPRWKRCVQATDRALGEALGQRYVEQTFGESGKARMLKMVDSLESALSEDINTLPWMTELTKKQAQIKLAAIRNKIGYPDQWRDYSQLTIKPGDLMGNFLRANEFESRRQIAKISKPLDRKEWGMTPPTVNAYYNGSNNEIVFPAGILQPPFFDRTIDENVNFGAIGAIIGHELTHGFDDQGRKFDSQGNLRDWWAEQDAKEFEKRASCIAQEYSNFIAVDNLKLNGSLTLGENTADNGGVRIALIALQKTNGQPGSPASGNQLGGYTPEQRFFLGWAQVWCEKRRPEYSRMLVNVDPHSPGRYRVNGVMENMPEFDKVWGCKAGRGRGGAEMCRVW
ncbi:MAG: M13 family metallopeptidase [Acidobacteria bacterium]|nr:M13 family metallopeptidase [Acidobacteriota bacterium]